MKLKNVKIQKYNILSYAIHRKYGILWTDGQIVYLTPLSTTDESLCANPAIVRHPNALPNSIVLGEFKHVRSVGWSDGDHPRPFLSAVVLGQDSETVGIHFQVWQVMQIFPKAELALILNQFVPHPPARYGCPMWDDNVKKLCLLTKRLCRIFHYDEDLLKLDPKNDVLLDPGKDGFRCASWSQDSKVLLLATGSSVDLYEADVGGVGRRPFRTLDVCGTVAATAITGEAFLCSCELQLEMLLCGTTDHVAPSPEAVLGCKGDGSPADDPFEPSEDPASKETSSLLLLSELGRILVKVDLECVLIPNLLTWLPFRNWCVVGSTDSKTFHVFALHDGKVSKVKDASLPMHLRPHGIVPTGKNDDDVYIALANRSAYGHLFPASRERTTLDIARFSVDALAEGRLDIREAENEVEPTQRSGGAVVCAPPVVRRFDGEAEATLERFADVLLRRAERKEAATRSIDPVVERRSVSESSALNRATSKNSSTDVVASTASADGCYPSLADVETVSVRCEYVDDDSGCTSECHKEVMLLPGGRLKVAAIARAFDLRRVEIFTGRSFCAIAEDADGCLPVRFRNKDRLSFRGKRTTEDEYAEPAT